MFGRFFGYAVLAVALLVIGDSAVCPVLCMSADSASHKSTNFPSQGSSSAVCGACSIGIVARASDIAAPPHILTTVSNQPFVDKARSAAIADIDPPPRPL